MTLVRYWLYVWWAPMYLSVKPVLAYYISFLLADIISETWARIGLFAIFTLFILEMTSSTIETLAYLERAEESDYMKNVSALQLSSWWRYDSWSLVDCARFLRSIFHFKKINIFVKLWDSLLKFCAFIPKFACNLCKKIQNNLKGFVANSYFTGWFDMEWPIIIVIMVNI